MVTVNAPSTSNTPPTIVGSITALSLTAGGTTGTRDVASNFSDTDALTYTVSSDDMAIATVAVSDDIVTVTPVAEGSTTITVTATDTAMQPITQTFMVTVNAPSTPNTPPTTVGSITALTLTAGGATGTRDVEGNFSDTDALTYTAISDDMAIAMVMVVVDSIVMVTPVAQGSTTITVTATDTAMQSITQTFMVTVYAIPTVSTTSASDVTFLSTTFEGNITSDGGRIITERGFVYSSSNTDPEIDGAKVTKEIVSGTETDDFSKEIKGLRDGETYHYKAYAINSVGTSYGTVISLKIVIPPIIYGFASSGETIAMTTTEAAVITDMWTMRTLPLLLI